MPPKFALIVSQFNTAITDKLLEGAHSQLLEKGIHDKDIIIFEVPGAIEIPLIAQLLAKTNEYQAIICLGAVIRGETDHYHYVCDQVSRGCQKVMLEFDIPVIFGVLTTDTENQANDRVGGKDGHKGVEAANAAIAMLEVMEKIPRQSQ